MLKTKKGVSVCATAMVGYQDRQNLFKRSNIQKDTIQDSTELHSSGELKVLAPARPRRPRVPPGPRRLVARPPECLGCREA